MKPHIYFFSGTGNTYSIAKKMTRLMNGELFSIPRLMKAKEIRIQAKCIVILFPSYFAPLSGFPLIIERFINQIPNIENLEIHGICNSGGYEVVNALVSLNRFQQIIQHAGGKCRSLQTLRMPMSVHDYDNIPLPINKNTDEILKKSDIKVVGISKNILKHKPTGFRFLKSCFLFMLKPMKMIMNPLVMHDLKQRAKVSEDGEYTFYDLIPSTDKSIEVNQKCTGCGICAKICPVDNIQMIDDRPSFKHHCEVCFACDEWCPHDALNHWGRPGGIKYRNPEVELKDMLKINGK